MKVSKTIGKHSSRFILETVVACRTYMCLGFKVG